MVIYFSQGRTKLEVIISNQSIQFMFLVLTTLKIKYISLTEMVFNWLIDWLIDWCLTQSLATFQLYRGVNKCYINEIFFGHFTEDTTEAIERAKKFQKERREKKEQELQALQAKVMFESHPPTPPASVMSIKSVKTKDLLVKVKQDVS